MLKSLVSLVTNRLLWGFLGITALSLLIWTVGPLIAIGDYRPFESERNRYITIAALYLLWSLFRVVPRLYRAWFNRRMLRQLQIEQEKAALKESLEADAPLNNALQQRFSEAIQLLKKARFNQGKGKNWMNYFNRQYLYQLPWFVIIGAPGAGKTTALSNSGLPFPLAEKFGKSALQGVGGTKNCDWWFTDEAVLLDTAGRYTTHESHQQEDAGEWNNFVSLLKKYRARQPINGIIVTVSVSDLLTLTEEARLEQATQLRKRLIELHDQLSIHFPVYVMVTKTDLLRGFTAYFNALDKQQRDQIWGFTFPYQQSQQQNFSLRDEISQQYQLLQQRLEAALPDILLREHDAHQRAESFLFPQEFAVLRPLLTQYLDTVFAISSYETRFSARGVYFTSASQEGLPFDRVMGNLNRYLQIADVQHQDNLSSADWDSISQDAPIPASKGQSFFLKDLLQHVIFQESGLAGNNRWWIYRNNIVHILGYSVLGVVFVGLCIFWYNSYLNNKSYLAEVAKKIPAVEEQGKRVSTVVSGEMLSLLPILNNILGLSESDTFSVDNPPLKYRLGLYRGNQVEDAAQSLYQRALSELLLPQVSQYITDLLRNDSHHDSDYSYEALKAYQMLYQMQNYDGKFLRDWVVLNQQRDMPVNITQKQLQQLEWHLSQLLEEQVQTSPFAKDEALIKQTQIMLSKTPLSQRVYSRLKRELMQQESFSQVTLITLAGSQTELALSRKSGKPLSEGISTLFTPKGYWNVFNPQIPQVAKILNKEDIWVLGSQIKDSNSAELEKTVRLLYMQEFIRNWDQFLEDIQLSNIASLTQRINSARLLSDQRSPLRQLAVNLASNLMLGEDPNQKPKEGEKRTMMDKAESTINSGTTSRILYTLFTNKNAMGEGGAAILPEQVVSMHYAPLIELGMAPSKENPEIPFDAVLKQMDDLYNYLTAVQSASNSGMPSPTSEVIPKLQAESGRLPVPFKNMVLSLTVGASSDTQKKEMESIKKRAGVEVGGFCRQAIAGRYPLTRGATNEITPDDLSRMFAPGTGLMDVFFRENLQGKIDTSRANWRFLPGVDGKSLPGGEGILRSFQQAQRIRDTFFSGGSVSPSYRVTIRPIKMDSAILSMTLDVDGQVITYSHGPQVQQVVSWPGTRNTNQVQLQISLVDGGTSSLVTSGPWALNRLLDKAKKDASNKPGALSHQATFSLGQHNVTMEFAANSIRNPFNVSAFSCPL